MSLTKLRGRPATLRARRGKGYFGEVFQEDDPEWFTTELPITIEFDGHTHRIPTIVPTLTREELAHLADGGDMTPDIVHKAIAYAQTRLAAGRSCFAARDEQGPLPA